MKKFNKISLILALVMVVTALMIPAVSYFTTYAQARGGHPLRLGQDTEIHEDFASWRKTVQVENHHESVDVYVRARAYTGALTELAYSGTGWTLGEDGYYYYSDPVKPGEKTGVLNIDIKAPAATEEGDRFDVIVVYQSVQAWYNDDGTAVPADWNQEWEEHVQEGGN
jgi:hypothetical protein